MSGVENGGFTESEIEAGALALFRFDSNWAQLEPSDEQVRAWWDCQPETIRGLFRQRARLVLEAAGLR